MLMDPYVHAEMNKSNAKTTGTKAFFQRSALPKQANRRHKAAKLNTPPDAATSVASTPVALHCRSRAAEFQDDQGLITTTFQPQNFHGGSPEQALEIPHHPIKLANLGDRQRQHADGRGAEASRRKMSRMFDSSQSPLPSRLQAGRFFAVEVDVLQQNRHELPGSAQHSQSDRKHSRRAPDDGVDRQEDSKIQ